MYIEALQRERESIKSIHASKRSSVCVCVRLCTCIWRGEKLQSNALTATEHATAATEHATALQ
jgi:hypothetical protein